MSLLFFCISVCSSCINDPRQPVYTENKVSYWHPCMPWCHFLQCWPFGNPLVTSGFPYKGSVMQNFLFSLFLAWTSFRRISELMIWVALIQWYSNWSSEYYTGKINSTYFEDIFFQKYSIFTDADQRRHQSSTPLACATSLCHCEGNSVVTGEFPAQRASDMENVSIWWRHHAALTQGPQKICNIKLVIFKPISRIDILSIFCKITIW